GKADAGLEEDVPQHWARQPLLLSTVADLLRYVARTSHVVVGKSVGMDASRHPLASHRDWWLLLSSVARWSPGCSHRRGSSLPGQELHRWRGGARSGNRRTHCVRAL